MRRQFVSSIAAFRKDTSCYSRRSIKLFRTVSYLVRLPEPIEWTEADEKAAMPPAAVATEPAVRH